MIRDYFENEHGHSALAQSVYVALSELASDEQSETFTAPISQIARHSGTSYRTTANILKRFESLKLIHVSRSTVPGTKEHAPSTYSMLGMACLTLGKQNRKRLPRRLNNQNNQNKLNTAKARGRDSTRKVKFKQRPASPALVLEEAKNPDWLRRTPIHVLRRRRDQYQNERSRLLREYSNGASGDSEKVEHFRRVAPVEARRRYDWLRPKIADLTQAITERSKP